MIARFTLGLLLALLSLTGYAQRDTSFYRQTPVPAHLRPIERAVGSSALGSVYFYGGRKLNSPFSLEVPFIELNDPQVNQHFRSFRTWTTISRLTGLASLAYFVTTGSTSRSGQYWTVYGGSVVLALGTVIIANAQVNKAVGRYNTMLRQVPSGVLRVGAAYTPTPLGTSVVGVGGALTIR
ncbi:hypothetical protein [Fibrivirga algicola]|uniref:DUF5683 domain-containing protein n=1 Tax=Fibrivirga algicola TaxID=2950420 RepID=A0ABX0QDN0_9BACT|nr:hypothetical protein [Fibrivirga algicola]NID10279.1 hypothetical protein [Fibrivirga algicola]